jgi:acyl-CoA reductase-like NAD-dependent aldehyde dehydrogenase
VVAAITFEDDAEALKIANGLSYGLCVGVYSRDLSRALTLARGLEAGSVWINGWFLGGVQAPTGGVKDISAASAACPASATTSRSRTSGFD